MITIVMNPYFILVILYDKVYNPKIIDNELITKYLDNRFIVNLGVSYNDHI